MFGTTKYGFFDYLAVDLLKFGGFSKVDEFGLADVVDDEVTGLKVSVEIEVGVHVF